MPHTQNLAYCHRFLNVLAVKILDNIKLLIYGFKIIMVIKLAYNLNVKNDLGAGECPQCM